MHRLRALAWLAACAAVAPAVVPAIAPIGASLGAQSPADAATSARRSAAVRVMTVESPALDGRAWHYTVQMVPGARLLGAAAGTAAPSRALMLTVQLTDALSAGDQMVGTVRFTDGALLVERPLRVQVPPRLMINVAVARALRTAQPGEVLFLPFTIANRGNSTDTLQLKLATPSGWEATLTSVPLLVLASGSQATVTARVRPPVTLSAGSGLVALQATDASAVHGAGVLVEVGATRAASHLGPEMVMGVANVRDATGALQQAYSFALQGPVRPGHGGRRRSVRLAYEQWGAGGGCGGATGRRPWGRWPAGRGAMDVAPRPRHGTTGRVDARRKRVDRQTPGCVHRWRAAGAKPYGVVRRGRRGTSLCRRARAWHGRRRVVGSSRHARPGAGLSRAGRRGGVCDGPRRCVL
ncbi:MAG: NEW3 domain-containing protein [Gemmatimonadetes bacterium]|nr:NEW3 domain-containing protein [Gemmatimonadota bacterium]